MLITFFLLISLSVLLFLNRKFNPALLWASLLTFAGGAGALGRVLVDQIVPELTSHELIIVAQLLYIQLSFLNILGLPYIFLLFSLTYTQKKVLHPMIKLILMLPIIISILTAETSFPHLKYNYIVVTAWVAPYIIYGYFILIKDYYTLKNYTSRKSNLITIILLFPVPFQLVSVYIPRCFNHYENYKWNQGAVIAMFFLFLFFVIKFEVLEIRTHFKIGIIRDSPTTNGISILNHMLKNEMNKFMYLTSRTKLLLSNNDITAAYNYIGKIEGAVQHISGMIEVIKDNAVQEIQVEKLDLVELLRKTVEQNLLLESEVVSTRFNICNRPSINGDAVQLQEVISNILNNAVEAMDGLNKELDIYVYVNKGQAVIEISDNGVGIPMEYIHKVIIPFFSTKKLKGNHGLGLSYCSKVMEKHGGEIQLESKEGCGTKVKLVFSKKCLVRRGADEYT
ncbi:ATP-binding protein [Paenibacillus sp. FSL P2-0136]|uniref:sensor histidine kinase n=1 Tax=Paenibacillus sp. FSL P2-0136 TaxID=2975317 RepID=UPI0030D7E3AC